MKKFRALLGIFLLVAIMVSLFSSASPVGAATTKEITVSIYKSPKVKNNDDTLKGYVTTAINTISGTSSATNLDLTINGPYLKEEWTECYAGSTHPVIQGNSSQRYITMSFYKYQLGTNGYAECASGSGCDYALVDIDPNGWGTKTCDGDRTIANWKNQKATTHELAHLFTAQDGKKTMDAMDKNNSWTTGLKSPAKEVVKDYLDNDW